MTVCVFDPKNQTVYADKRVTTGDTRTAYINKIAQRVVGGELVTVAMAGVCSAVQTVASVMLANWYEDPYEMHSKMAEAREKFLDPDDNFLMLVIIYNLDKGTYRVKLYQNSIVPHDIQFPTKEPYVLASLENAMATQLLCSLSKMPVRTVMEALPYTSTQMSTDLSGRMLIDEVRIDKLSEEFDFDTNPFGLY